MKTIKEINKEIEELMKELKVCDFKKKPHIESKIKFRKQCVLYLETNPGPEYLINQKESLLKKIELYKQQFDQWKIGRCLTTYKDSYATYLQQMGVPELKAKIITLDYLLL